MPKLPRNMVRRKGRPGYYFRKKSGGHDKWIALGPDLEQAKLELKRLLGMDRVPIADLTVGKSARKWLETQVATSRNSKQQAMALSRVARYFDPFLGHILLRRLEKDQVREFRLWLEKREISLATVGHILADLRCFLNWAEDSGLVDRSPFPRRVMPRLQERPPDRLPDEEAQALRELPEPYGFVCRLALGTGLRWGELTRAQAADVERGFLLVHHTKSRKIRRVPLPPELLTEVRSHVGRLVPFAEKSPGSFAKAVRRATDIERFHVHQMRHTFACQWIEQGRNLVALQQILGHASIETTQRYAKLSDDAVMREAARPAESQNTGSWRPKEVSS